MNLEEKALISVVKTMFAPAPKDPLALGKKLLQYGQEHFWLKLLGLHSLSSLWQSASVDHLQKAFRILYETRLAEFTEVRDGKLNEFMSSSGMKLELKLEDLAGVVVCDGQVPKGQVVFYRSPEGFVFDIYKKHPVDESKDELIYTYALWDSEFTDE